MELTGLGPFFAAETHDPGDVPAAPWRPMSELRDDPAVLAERVHAARALLAVGGGGGSSSSSSSQDAEAVELRVAASVIQLGLVARIVSPLVALAVLRGRTAPVTLRDLRWQPAPGSTFPLSIAGTDTDAGTDTGTVLGACPADSDRTPEALAHALGTDLIEAAVTELCDAFRPFRVSPHVLWGNVASALNGACGILARAHPDRSARVNAVLSALLRHPALAGTWQLSLDDRFQRRSCCLIYRAAPGQAGPLCGDCVLLGRHRRPAAAR